MMAECPLNGKIYYFLDKCLPFGSSISCAIFQDISDGIAAILRYKTGKPTLNYLDDFFSAASWKYLCDQQLQDFIDICSYINFPIAVDKTFWGMTRLVFLGLLLDTINQVVCIPADKVS